MLTLLSDYDLISINEAVSNNRLTGELLDIEKFVKVNNCAEIIDPVFFNGPSPTPLGLLSNEIFGITKAERSGIYAYIDLGGTFIHPLAYKALCNLNSKIASIVNGIETFSIDDSGQIVKDPNGSTGIDWLRKNFDKINFNTSDSIPRQRRIKFIEKNKKIMWINKYIVIPPYYRDVDTKQASIGVGEINKLYSSLILACKSLKETADYGISLSDSNKGRIQTILKQIFDWFGGGTTINGQETSGNLPGKTGLIKKGIMYKTVDYSVRLVLSCPELKAESIEDIMVDMDHAAEPLAAVIVNFKPFIIFWLRRFFENLFAGKMEWEITRPNNEIYRVPLEDYQITFSDIEINKQIERFVHGYSNRFIPVPVPIDKVKFAEQLKKDKIKLNEDNLWMVFKGSNLKNDEYIENQDYSSYPLIQRPLTWCDLFYMAACDVVQDKMILITRFPIDSYLNQYPSKIRVKSTIKTESLVVNSRGSNHFYKWYPRIRKEDILSNTSPLFSDTMSISNGLINAMGADYDGDTCIVKPVYTIEANAECEKAANAKVQVIGMDGKATRDISKENIVCLYCLTNCPDKSVKLIDPVF